MIKPFVLSKSLIVDLNVTPFLPFESGDEEQRPELPPLTAWLARLRLLVGVPFAYLISNPDLLERECIRFFYLNRSWTDALVEGALSIAGASSRDLKLLKDVYGDVREEIDRAEPQVWDTPGQAVEVGGVITGFLLRSRAVSGWPGLHIRGSREGQYLKLLRVERLAPSVLLVLMDGIPDRVEIEEPRQGVQFGVTRYSEHPHQRSVEIRRHPKTGALVAGASVPVPFREEAPGVIDVEGLRDRIKLKLAEQPVSWSEEFTPAVFAQQLAVDPYCQVFENVS